MITSRLVPSSKYTYWDHFSSFCLGRKRGEEEGEEGINTILFNDMIEYEDEEWWCDIYIFSWCSHHAWYAAITCLYVFLLLLMYPTANLHLSYASFCMLLLWFSFFFIPSFIPSSTITPHTSQFIIDQSFIHFLPISSVPILLCSFIYLFIFFLP